MLLKSMIAVICCLTFGMIVQAAEADNNLLQLSPEEKAFLISIKDKPIRLAPLPEVAPYEFFDGKGNFKGISADFFELFQQYLGVDIEIVKDLDQKEIIKGIIEKRIDMIPGLLNTPERSKTMLFSHGYLPFSSALIVQKTTPSIRDESDLPGKKVALVQGHFASRILLEKYPDIIPIYVNRALDALKKVSEGKAEATVFVHAPSSYLVSRHVLTNLKVASILDWGNLSGSVAVRKDWPQMISLLNKSISAVPERKKDAIFKRWVSMEVDSHKGSNVRLTTAEKVWLGSHPEIRVAVQENLPPLMFSDDQGKNQGLTVEYLKKIKSMTGLRFKFVSAKGRSQVTPSRRPFADIYPCVVRVPDNDKYMSYTSPYIQVPTGIFAGHEAAYISDLHKIRGEVIAVVNKSAVHFHLKNNYPELTLLPVKNSEEGIRSIIKKHVFAFVDNTVTTGDSLRRHSNLNVKLVGEIPFVSGRSIGVRKDWPTLNTIIEKSLTAISAMEKNEIYNHWIPIVYEKPKSYRLIWQISSGCLLIFCLIIFWNRKLKVEVHRRTLAVKKSEALLNAVGGMADVGGWELDPLTNEVKWTEQTYRIHEVSMDYKPNLEGAIDFYHVEDREKISMAVDKSLNHGEPFDLEVRLITARGNHIWTRAICYPQIAGGKVVKLLGIFQNITDRKKAEKDLRRSEELLNSTQRLSKIGGWSWEKEKQEMYWTDEVYRIHGFDPDLITLGSEEHITKSLECYQPEDRQIIMNAFTECVEEGRAYDKDLQFTTMKGRRLWIRTYAQPVIEKGEVKRIIGNIMDITRHKQSEEALRESEQRYRNMFENAVVGIFRTTPDGQILEANPQVARIMGYKSPDALKKEIHDISRLYTDPMQRNQMINTIIQKGLVKHFETTVTRKDNKMVTLSISSYAVRNKDGSIRYLEGTIEDITALKKARKEREAFQEQLQHTQKLESIGTLASGIAHDFNNILSSILGFGELVEQDLPKNNPRISANMHAVIEAGHRAKELVQHILAFSRHSELDKRPVQISPLIKETVKFLRASIPTSIQIEVTINDKNFYVSGDATQIHQIIMNLCTNATHAMKAEGGTLTIGIEAISLKKEDVIKIKDLMPGKYLKMIIKDTGHGIPDNIIDRIFDPFYTTKNRGEGTGMGLSVTHGIVRQMKGKIDVKSPSGKGTEFNIYFPAKEKKSPVLDTGSKIHLEHGYGHILFVDDEDNLVTMMSELLTRLGYTVEGFNRSSDALNEFQSRPDEFDMLITDFDMPGMDGLDLTVQVKRIDPDLPVILCTGFSGETTEAILTEAGIGAMLIKPVIMPELTRVIKKMMLKV